MDDWRAVRRRSLVGEPLWLDPVGEAAGTARRYVRDTLLATGHAELVECAELGVSELVANVCLHARTRFTVALHQSNGGRVRIDVADFSTAVPTARRYGRMATTGRGLRLLDAVGRWGVEPNRRSTPGKTVWFEPATQMADDGLLDTEFDDVDDRDLG